MAETAVVILNWNGVSLLETFLPQVVQYSQDADIYVVDNGSSDNSVEYIKKSFSKVSLITFDQNKGFCKGYNDALKNIKADYLVLLNSDIEVTPSWLKTPIEILKNNKDIAVCQPKIRSFHKKELFEYGGAAGGYIDYLGYPFCRGRIFDNLEIDQGQYDDDLEIFWASGAAFFIKSKVFLESDGFDERFFAHMEEIDLCWRIQNLGYKIKYCSQSLVYHVGGGTLNYSSPQKTYLNFRNSLILLHKNKKGINRFSCITQRLLLDGLAGLKFLLSGIPSHTTAILRAHIHYYKGIFRWSNGINNKGNTPNIYPKSIVWQHYVKKITKFSGLNWK